MAKKPKQRSPEQEMIVAHILAVQGALQALTHLLEDSGAITPGHFPAALDAVASLHEDKGRDLVAKLVLDLRSSLTDAPRLKRSDGQNS